MARLKIYTAQNADVNQGWVWLGRSDLSHRSIVRLFSADTRKSVYCEVLTIDDNFLRSYNQPSRIQIAESQSALVIAEWYRMRLGGLKTLTEADIEVTPANGVCGRVRACLDHPQVVVRLAVILALWSFVLGVIGFVLVIASIIIGIIPLLK
jgi:hypothetical protein